ncbi:MULTISPECIES: hypothetical protein [Streptomyces]|uniref:Putative integral membrane protein n=1 Tax=Streptomyces venezuelae (strain ATCC 10712 / CBS 650.69 / DSM 40230 / JCM 4526 / NBRC 13096 / PD 04745) TaxID=953739 RepID=F2RFM2_STRVP|nr:hypothetical protein [Streptomyces venezuelae]APE22914.1 hypothetical protein vnz_19205 [Streptomyces venezuelae]QES00294.1 hypothetical protein DEJ43_19470 [Streptomyces venezuelae ATCC 10712]CCA57174.1 putative integral membrane protein [Streptomyces venezuelae ATCC 10712]
MSPGDEHDSFGGVGGSGQTRTRLPEGNSGDVYGGARRPVRSSRSLITVVGVVVLLVAAIAFANRGGGDPADAAGPAKDTPGQNAPTAATGVRPVTGKNGRIPTGYSHDDQGAQSAATNYAVALGSAEMFNAATRSEIVRTVYAPAVAAANQDDFDKAYTDKGFLSRVGLQEDGSAPQGLTFISRTIPVGSKVESYADDKATVSVWYTSLFGLAGDGSKNPVTEAWYTNSYELQWVDGDWKVTALTQKDGPVPVARDQRASTAQEMRDAVGQFGGFTYAR